MNTKKVITYTAVTLLLAYAIQIPASLFYKANPNLLGQNVFKISLMFVMFVPLIATLITNKTLKGIGWKPKFKGCGFLIPLCIIGPHIIAALGGALFYAIFPECFDVTGSYLKVQGEQLGVDLIAQLESQGLSIGMYNLITILSAIFYAPIINAFLAIGEEVGWRGFLYPELNKKFGRVTTWIIGGTIWSAFHFPAMIIAGYEYGTNYPGFPILGLVTFTLFCIICGVFAEMVYSKSKCIWYPSLLHGSINASTGALLFINAYNPDIDKMQIFGPMHNGLIAMIPSLLLTVIVGLIVLKKAKKERL